MARRTLISESDVLDAARRGERIVLVPPGAVITPSARDAAREKGITLAPVATAPPGAASATGNSPSGVPSAPPGSAALRVVAIGSDHGGFALKTELKTLLAEIGWAVEDVGTDSEASCDYPDFAYAVGRYVQSGRAGFGIMIDGAGIGSAMVCNKIRGIRAACAYNEFTAWNARAHNDANVLTLGSRTLGIEVVKGIVRKFLETPFEGGRHAARVAKISDVEQTGS